MNILEDLYKLRHSIYESSTIENTLNHFMWFSDNTVDINLKNTNDITSSTEKFYYIDFISFFSIESIIDVYSTDSVFLKKIKELLKEDNFRLVFMDMHETQPYRQIEKLFNLFNNHQEKIIFINNDSNLKNLNSKTNIKTFKTNFLWKNTAKTLLEKFQYFDLVWNEEKREKMFLCVNKEGKEHRFFTICLLDMYGLLDNTNYSFLTPPKTKWDDFRESDFDKSNKSFSYYKKNHINKMKKPKLTQYESYSSDFKDVENLFETGYDFAGKVNPKDYRNSYISIITESVYWFDGIHITEKSLKPFCLPVLPIFVASPNHVKTLRDDYNLDLFDDFINHDYDKELDNTKRLKMIIEECLRLSRLENEIIDFYKNNKDRFLNNKNSILEFTKQTDVHISNSIINF
tara:strand:+ start:213 stop:1418 length:1206 start_codon:yes stop_codon:yes gene_type:complete